MSFKLLKIERAALAAVAICVATAPSPSWAETPDAWLAYVEAKEDLYVDTGVVAKRGTKVEYRGTYGSPTPLSPNRDILVGASAGGNANEWGLIRDSNNKISLVYNNSTKMETAVVFPPASDAMLTITSEVTTNGASSSIQVTGDATGSKSGNWNGADLTQTLYLFARNANGTADKFSRGKCYGFRVWQVPDGATDYVLVRDLKPCSKNGVVGLYDVVHDEILFPGASGRLLGSEIPSREPDAYLEYVQATMTGSQYIDTGIVAKRGTKVEYRGTYGSPNPSSPNRDILVGASAGGTGGNANEWGLIRNCSSKISLAYNNNSATMKTSVVFPPDVDAMFTITSEVTQSGANSSIHVTGDATGTAAGTWNGADLAQTLYLFARNADGTADKFSRGKCYGFRIWQVPDGGTDYALVRDLKPCLCDGEAALFDEVERKIYRSCATTGRAFVAGPVVCDGEPDTFLEYAEATSAQTIPYLDTGITTRRGTKVEYVGTYCGSGNSRSILLGGGPGLPNVNESIHAYELVRNNGGYIGTKLGASAIAFPPDEDEVFTIVTEVCPASVSVTSGHVLTVTSGSQSDTITTSGYSYDTECSLYLYGYNHMGVVDATRRCWGKCHSLKIWQIPPGGTEYVLVRDYAPCMKDGMVGFYDKVRNKVYLPTVGAFVAGPRKKKQGIVVIVK